MAIKPSKEEFISMNKDKIFGTDGIRGTPGKYPLNHRTLAKIAKALTQYILKNRGNKTIPRIILGRDTRLSGTQIESSLGQVFSSYGIDVSLIGIITTPGLSYLVKELKADIGIMISASHNKAEDNGIKFFNAQGQKLSAKEEEKIEEIFNDKECKDLSNFAQMRKGKINFVNNAQTKYMKFLISTVKGLNLKGIRIALDCASGSASPFAKKMFKQLKAKVNSIHDTIQGENINLGGAMAPQLLKQLVLKKHANLGIALDGDGDRGILIDEKGNILDGDYILAIMAYYLIKKQKLLKDTIVTTVMSNYGLRSFLDNIGVKSIITKVGDKYVLEALLEHNLNLGGEQSGHIIFLDHSPTPDGLLTALQMLKVMQETQICASELAQCITKFPQILVNIKVKERKPFEDMPSVSERLQYFNAQLKDEGRILLRYSGTESLARVMVEGKDKRVIENIANSLADQIRQEIGL